MRDSIADKERHYWWYRDISVDKVLMNTSLGTTVWLINSEVERREEHIITWSGRHTAG